MRHSLRLVVITLILGAAFAAGRWMHAQVPVQPQNPSLPRGQVPVIITGPDLGFRLDGPTSSDGRPAGRLVVRIDGQWVEPKWTMGVTRLTGN